MHLFRPGLLRLQEVRCDPRDSKIQKLGGPLFGDETILRLRIPVNDALAMCSVEPLRNRDCSRRCLFPAQRGSPPPRAKRFSVEKLHHLVHDAVLGSSILDRKDVGMTERGHRLSLALQTREGERMLGEVGAKYLDRHIPTQKLILGAVDLAHRASADQSDDLVSSEDSSYEGGALRRAFRFIRPVPEWHLLRFTFGVPAIAHGGALRHIIPCRQGGAETRVPYPRRAGATAATFRTKIEWSAGGR